MDFEQDYLQREAVLLQHALLLKARMSILVSRKAVRRLNFLESEEFEAHCAASFVQLSLRASANDLANHAFAFLVVAFV